MLVAGMIGIQLLQEGKLPLPTLAVEDTQEKLVESELEEPDSDDENPPFNPETEDYTMTENPMLRHRNVTESSTPAMEMVD